MLLARRSKAARYDSGLAWSLWGSRGRSMPTRTPLMRDHGDEAYREERQRERDVTPPAAPPFLPSAFALGSLIVGGEILPAFVLSVKDNYSVRHQFER